MIKRGYNLMFHSDNRIYVDFFQISAVRYYLLISPSEYIYLLILQVKENRKIGGSRHYEKRQRILIILQKYYIFYDDFP